MAKKRICEVVRKLLQIHLHKCTFRNPTQLSVGVLSGSYMGRGRKSTGEICGSRSQSKTRRLFCLALTDIQSQNLAGSGQRHSSGSEWNDNNLRSGLASSPLGIA